MSHADSSSRVNLAWRYCLVQARLIVGIGLGGLLFSTAGEAQVQIPPSVIQQQADREHKKAEASAGTTGDPQPLSKNQQQIEALRTAALGDDTAGAVSALHKLRSMGAGARPALRDVVGQLLARDGATFESARALPSAADLRDLSEKIAQRRKAARGNIDQLNEGEPIRMAHEHYNALKGMWEKMQGVFVLADATARAASRRGELLTLWRDLEPADKQHADDTQMRLALAAVRALGLTAAQWASPVQMGNGEAPAEPVLRDLWFMQICRHITAYNAVLERYMTDGEVDNARLVNQYRMYLGLVPDELDPRLVQAARAHTQEMVTLKYFDHASPVPENRTPTDRARQAGYPRPVGENICAGFETGERAFWTWFDSPGHHKNMAGPHDTGLGVGNVGGIWTQVFGGAPRLILASSEYRKAVLANAKLPPKSE